MRPSARATHLHYARQRRLGMRLAAGIAPARAAAAENLPAADVESLLAEPEFASLVAAYRKLRDLSDAEKIARLRDLAWGVLERAMVDGDLRVCMFVAHEIGRGRDPARTAAEGVVRAERRATATPPSPPLAERPAPAPATPALRPQHRRPYCPVAKVVARGRTRARDLLAAEHEVAAFADAMPAAPARPRPAVTSALAARVARLAGSATAATALRADPSVTGHPGAVGQYRRAATVGNGETWATVAPSPPLSPRDSIAGSRVAGLPTHPECVLGQRWPGGP